MNQAAELLMSLYAHSAFDAVRARSSVLQYSFGFACGSFQYGRVVTYLSFASKRSFRNSFSASCIFARILLAVVGPTPWTEVAPTARTGEHRIMMRAVRSGVAFHAPSRPADAQAHDHERTA